MPHKNRNRVSFGGLDRPEDHVVRLINVDFDATCADIAAFFNNHGFDILDCRREINAKTGLLSVAHVLLRSNADVIRAEMSLNLKEVCGRPVRVFHARTGFKVRNDSLVDVNEEDGNHETPVASAAVQHVDAPSTDNSNLRSPTSSEHQQVQTVPCTPPQASLNRSRSSSNLRRKIAEIHARVLCILKIHPEANESSLKLFFHQYDVMQIKRKINPRTGRWMPIAFVMLGSREQRDHAVANLNNCKLMGRPVELQICNRGHRVNENGFIPDSDIGNESYSAFSRPTEVKKSPPDHRTINTYTAGHKRNKGDSSDSTLYSCLSQLNEATSPEAREQAFNNDAALTGDRTAQPDRHRSRVLQEEFIAEFQRNLYHRNEAESANPTAAAAAAPETPVHSPCSWPPPPPPAAPALALFTPPTPPNYEQTSRLRNAILYPQRWSSGAIMYPTHTHLYPNVSPTLSGKLDLNFDFFNSNKDNNTVVAETQWPSIMHDGNGVVMDDTPSAEYRLRMRKLRLGLLES